MVREEAMIVRRQTTDDVSATGSAVSGVFDSVGLVLSVEVLTSSVRFDSEFGR